MTSSMFLKPSISLYNSSTNQIFLWIDIHPSRPYALHLPTKACLHLTSRHSLTWSIKTFLSSLDHSPTVCCSRTLIPLPHKSNRFGIMTKLVRPMTNWRSSNYLTGVQPTPLSYTQTPARHPSLSSSLYFDVKDVRCRLNLGPKRGSISVGNNV